MPGDETFKAGAYAGGSKYGLEGGELPKLARVGIYRGSKAEGPPRVRTTCI